VARVARPPIRWSRRAVSARVRGLRRAIRPAPKPRIISRNPLWARGSEAGPLSVVDGWLVPCPPPTALEALPTDLGEDLLAKAETLLVEEADKLGPRELRTVGSRILERIAMEIRDNTCTEAACTMPAAYCEAHQPKPRSRGGQTNLDESALKAAEVAEASRRTAALQAC
jgi:hypothetical protein